jgi:CRISPR/Cas system-associated exonuclease Cas4 (RecB family)
VFTFCPPRSLPELHSETFPDGKRYYTTPSGLKLPSVTTVIGATPKTEIIEWKERVGAEEANRVSKIASGRGSRLHTLCENYLNNKPLGMTMPDALEMFLAIKPELNRINNIHYQECTLWSETLGLAGRVDCIGEFDGVLSVIDFKTSKRKKEKEDISDYFAQCTAYALMYEELVEITIGQIVVIMSVDHEQPLVFIEKTKDHIESLHKYIENYKMVA